MSEQQNKLIKLEVSGGNRDEPYLFVSYCRDDKAYVESALKIIDEAGYRLWFDGNINEEGELNFGTVLDTKIKNAHAILLFISKNSMQSKWVGRELLSAYRYGKKVYSFALLEDDGIDMSSDSIETLIPPLFQNYLMDDMQINTHINRFETKKSDSVHTIGQDEKWQEELSDLMKILPEATLQCLEIDDTGLLFKCKDNHKEITIPPEATIIGENAFKDCERLTNINLGTITAIQDNAFDGCNKLSEIHIPDTVTYMGEYAFKDCDEAKILTLPTGIEHLNEGIFDGCKSISSVNLPGKITDIPSNLFNGCKLLDEVKFPYNLTIIGESAFEACSVLFQAVQAAHKTITLPDSIRIIEDQAFAKCDQLRSVSLPEKLKKIGKSCFRDCAQLENIIIKREVDVIEASPFRGCRQLKNIEVDPKNTNYRSSPVSPQFPGENILFNKNRSDIICFPPDSQASIYMVPESVTHILEWAFSYCSNLQSIKISDSVDIIGANAFYKCTGLRNIFLPDGVTVIDDMAFRKCSHLQTIIIPASVRKIGYAIFSGCTQEITVMCQADTDAARVFKNEQYKNIKCNVISADEFEKITFEYI